MNENAENFNEKNVRNLVIKSSDEFDYKIVSFEYSEYIFWGFCEKIDFHMYYVRKKRGITDIKEFKTPFKTVVDRKICSFLKDVMDRFDKGFLKEGNLYYGLNDKY